jgi:transposase
VTRAADSTDFCDFLQKIKRKTKKKKVTVFMDNLNVHRSKMVKEKLDQLKFDYIFNAPYSPNGNPIESFFSVLKQKYRKLWMEELATGVQTNRKSKAERALVALSDLSHFNFL